MKQYAYLSTARYPYFKNAFLLSLVLHTLLFTFAAVAPLIPILKGKKGLTYTSTVRVDIVELPDQLMSEVNKNILSTQDAIRSLKKEAQSGYQDKDALQFKTKKQIAKLKEEATSAIARLKALQNLGQKQETEQKEVLRKGNVVTEGADVPPSDQEGIPLDAYRSMVTEKVKLRWALPSYLRKLENLSGELIIFLDSDGMIVRKQIVSSGNPEFDDYMNKSLEEALPFPSVPQEVQKDVRYDGISITFYARELK
ncbi:MAG: hypothetical protein A2Z91_02665 [Deltaproteobacteria bacterium GWA2_38_16]|nr:MAG: hypothetical protein A2Z91_02665 [Deltaproteobacteria bacterium GWA2_38_16]OGQ02095.1 MAG: hypothetical protein A3D19_08960 [Deltaproteobacteria bacterium RIFCSPHIGHO2_02_FULL_38_15]OGQ61648.1 MAG: hypothetical protein A3G92_07135 [Deltaproteobacteria bacterium RIFCSPLOWO2_12_FULL_38_8]HBQ21633.1 hypothetical protein [Deltaproteobacteria bacterium]